MKAILLLAVVTGGGVLAQTPTTNNIHSTLWPTRDPSATRLATDPFYCSTRPISSYLSPPEPTGALESAIYSFQTQLYTTCTLRGPQRLNCPFPAHSRWCAFGQPTSVLNAPSPVPTAVLPLYSSYASLASSWWSVNSASAVELARDCKNLWADAGVLGYAALNRTIALAGCYEEAVRTKGGSVGPMATGATPGSGVSSVGPRATNVARRGAEGLWVLAGGGVAAAAAANAAW